MKPLASTDRKIILTAELMIRRDGTAPTWAQIRAAIGDESGRRGRAIFASRMNVLRRRGLVAFDDRPGSLTIAQAGLRAAVRR